MVEQKRNKSVIESAVTGLADMPIIRKPVEPMKREATEWYQILQHAQQDFKTAGKDLSDKNLMKLAKLIAGKQINGIAYNAKNPEQTAKTVLALFHVVQGIAGLITSYTSGGVSLSALVPAVTGMLKNLPAVYRCLKGNFKAAVGIQQQNEFDSVGKGVAGLIEENVPVFKEIVDSVSTEKSAESSDTASSEKSTSPRCGLKSNPFRTER